MSETAVRQLAEEAAARVAFAALSDDPRRTAYIDGWERGYLGRKPSGECATAAEQLAHFLGHDDGVAAREDRKPKTTPAKERRFGWRYFARARARRRDEKPEQTPGLSGPENLKGES